MTRKTFVLLLVLAACEHQPDDDHVLAARMFTNSMSKSRFSEWELRATAGGRQCDVLLVQTPILIDAKMVETLHYGGGDYDTYDGGVQHFYQSRDFRGVVYRDRSNKVWVYGNVSEPEAEAMQPCH